MMPGSGFGMMRCCTAQYTPPAAAARTAAVIPTPSAIISPSEDCWNSASSSSVLEEPEPWLEESASWEEESDSEETVAVASALGAVVSA